jgi:hypothetical protein
MVTHDDLFNQKMSNSGTDHVWKTKNELTFWDKIDV